MTTNKNQKIKKAFEIKLYLSEYILKTRPDSWRSLAPVRRKTELFLNRCRYL